MSVPTVLTQLLPLGILCFDIKHLTLKWLVLCLPHTSICIGSLSNTVGGFFLAGNCFEKIHQILFEVLPSC